VINESQTNSRHLSIQYETNYYTHLSHHWNRLSENEIIPRSKFICNQRILSTGWCKIQWNISFWFFTPCTAYACRQLM